MFLEQLRSRTGEALLSYLTGIPGRKVELSDKSVHGTYVGFSPIAASRGASFEESGLEFTIDEGGITMLERVAHNGKPYDFNVLYSPEWVFHLEGCGMDNALALRQHATLTLASSIFCFATRFSPNSHDVIMLLGEGMLAALGVFVRKERGLKRLEKIYRRVPKEREVVPHTPDQWLSPINMENARDMMASGTLKGKLHIIEMAASNLWTGTDKEIEERIELVASGLKDPLMAVQIASLKTFQLGGRVVAGIDLVVDVLKKHRELAGQTIEEALDSAACLLYETFRLNKERSNLERDFGSSDIAVIHNVSCGRVTPPQAKALGAVAREVPAQRRWTQEHQAKLLDAVALVMKSDSVIGRAREIGERALTDYPLLSLQH